MKKLNITKKSYNEILNEFNSAYPNLPDHIFTAISAKFEEQYENINVIATDSLYPFSRFAAYGFASRNDYSPLESDGATCQLTITLKTAGAKTLPIGYKVSGRSSITGQQVIYELIAIGDSGGTDTIVVDAKQQTSFTDITLGLISGTDDWSKYWIGNYENIIKVSVDIAIEGVPYTRVDNFDNSSPTDTHFIIMYNSEGRALFELGDNVTGAKPANGDNISANIATSMGTLGKVAANDLTTNLGNDSDILSVTNDESSGGNDPESVESIRRNSQANVRFRGGIFTIDDIETYVTAKSSLSAKIVKAHAIPGVGSSVGTANVDIITNDLVNLSAGEKTTLDGEMIDLTGIARFPVYSQDPNFLNVTINGRVNARQGFDAAITRNLVKFSQQLTSSPIDNYVIDYYQTFGIIQTRTNVINVTFGHTFTVDEDSALEFIINEWVELLQGKIGREYGMKLELGDLYTMANELYNYGVEEYIIDLPTANQYPTDDEIINGTVTITPI